MMMRGTGTIGRLGSATAARSCARHGQSNVVVVTSLTPQARTCHTSPISQQAIAQRGIDASIRHVQKASKHGNRSHQSVRFTSSVSPNAQKACIKCNTTLTLNALSCSSCGALQPLPSELNAYELLGIDQANISNAGWDIDLNSLKLTWRKVMALTHPDRMGGKDEKEQQIAAQQSAMLNKAYETLREPLQRAHLLLEQLSSSAPSESESLEDAEVLMDVMELREELEDASDEAQVDQVRQRNGQRLTETLQVLQNAFSQTPPDVDTARKAAVALRYWTNIDKAAQEWQPGKRVEMQH